MNYLAHLFLSGQNDEILVGNLLGDFVIGSIDHERNNYLTTPLKKGVHLHRLIDSFADNHNMTRECNKKLHHQYHKYAGVLVDIFFDHFLTKHWERFSDEKFEVFRLRTYRAFDSFEYLLPVKMYHLVDSMKKHDWLKNYSEHWGVEKALLNIAKRTKHHVPLQLAMSEFLEHYYFFENNFLVFFPEIIRMCNEFLQSEGYSPVN